MSERGTSSRATRPQAGPAHRQTTGEASAVWLGWVMFTGIVLFCAGLLNTVVGLVALFKDDFYPEPAAALLIDTGYTVWGWVYLILGPILIAAGGGVLLGRLWARAAGVIVTVINAMVNLVFARAYPMWAVFAISFDFLAIYGLVVHGGEAKALEAKVLEAKVLRAERR